VVKYLKYTQVVTDTIWEYTLQAKQGLTGKTFLALPDGETERSERLVGGLFAKVFTGSSLRRLYSNISIFGD